jgi:hypothetical protein
VDAASPADHEANDGGSRPARRHEVDDGGRALGSLEIGLEDHRAGAISTRYPGRRIDRRDLPTAIFGRAEQRGKACSGIEAGPAEPVDRTVASHQGSGPTVADEGIVLDR